MKMYGVARTKHANKQTAKQNKQIKNQTEWKNERTIPNGGKVLLNYATNWLIIIANNSSSQLDDDHKQIVHTEKCHNGSYK